MKWGEGREQGQPATTNKEERRGKTTKHTTSRQNKTRKEGKEWGEGARRNPTLARRRTNSAKQNRQQSKNTAGRQLKQDSIGKEQTNS